MAGGHRILCFNDRKIAKMTYYFAYGSNMYVPRIKARVPSAKVISQGTLLSHQLKFHKIGRDGSAKCDVFFTGNPNHQVHGVLFTINISEKADLDRAEGLGNGYEIKTDYILLPNREQKKTFFYIATAIDEKLYPFDWYKEYVLQGAISNKLPKKYIEQYIANIEAIEDPDKERAAENWKALGLIQA